MFARHTYKALTLAFQLVLVSSPAIAEESRPRQVLGKCYETMQRHIVQSIRERNLLMNPRYSMNYCVLEAGAIRCNVSAQEQEGWGGIEFNIQMSPACKPGPFKQVGGHGPASAPKAKSGKPETSK